ncbi:MAG TPA: tetratricopeptide repeat protein, partial [Vicinamibacteria bacterium]
MGAAPRVVSVMLLGAALACRAPLPADHLTVTAVGAGGTAARAGIRPGDVLLRWERGPAGGALGSLDALRHVELEEAPLAGVVLRGRRGGSAIQFSLSSDDWQLEASGPPAATPLAAGPLAGARRHADAGARHLEAVDLARAQAEWQLARQQAEAVSADNLLVARACNGLGAVAQLQGDEDGAESLYARALALAEARDREGRVATTALANLGALRRRRGDYAAAEELLRRALAVHERHDPEGEEAAQVLNALGVLAKDRGDLEEAEGFYQRALAIYERRAPDSLRAAGVLNNLGNAARQRGDLGAAEDFHRRALAIREARQPGGLDAAASLHNLGQVALDAGRREEAEGLLRRSLERKRALAPGSALLANTLLALGRAALERDDLAGARDLYRQALELRTRLLPDTAAEAEAWQAWGELQRREGRAAAALEAWRRAAAALEAQRGRLGGDLEVRLGFSARHADLFQSLMELLVDAGLEAEAFHVLERSRARALLQMLAERDLAGDVPPAVAAARRRLDREYDRVQEELAGASLDGGTARLEAARRRLRALRGEREALAARARAASPALASLRYPQPLDLAGARRVLDPGTVLV